jgi:hypothetical protein
MLLHDPLNNVLLIRGDVGWHEHCDKALLRARLVG